MDWQKEIESLHHFFEGWLGGSLAKSEAVYQRFSEVMGEGFSIVNPNGHMRERSDIIRHLFEAHHKAPGIRIWTEAPRLHHQLGSTLLASYQEWQEVNGKQNTRLSTVLFKLDPSAPHGVVWLHVHETWCDAD